MGGLKSQVNVYIDLLSALMLDNPFPKSAQTSISRDVSTIRLRVAAEGLNFLTKELPKIGKALDLGLETGEFPQVEGFRSRPGSVYPQFLESCTSRVFAPDGTICPEPDVEAIRFIRQVCFMFYKLEQPYSDIVVDSFLSNFVATDEDLPTCDRDFDESQELLSRAGNLITMVFTGFNPKSIVPRHGPGAVATGERLEEKWEFSRLYNRIHQVYPYYEYFIAGGATEIADRLTWYQSLERLDSGCAKVVLVPKDSRGPRLISCEPLEYQWIQQGLGRSIMSHLETNYLTRGQVNFTYQSINQLHALQSSRTKEYATIDLKDASDRVSLSLVRSLFRNLPDVLRALEATRSTHTLLPDGRRLELKKFAPMGSALCFPIEAVCFWALCVAGISLRRRIDFREVTSKVFVYGDDIIVPSSFALDAMAALESVHLAVNRSKSYYRGHFRESCGIDAFNGTVVTPLRVRKPFTHQNSDGTCFAAWTALANSLMLNGYGAASAYVFGLVEDVYGKLPYGTSNSSFPCRLVTDPATAEELNKQFLRWRVNGDYQRIEFEVRFLKNRRRKSDLDGWQRLLRDLTMPFDETSDPSVVVVPRTTQIKRGWSPV